MSYRTLRRPMWGWLVPCPRCAHPMRLEFLGTFWYCVRCLSVRWLGLGL